MTDKDFVVSGDGHLLEPIDLFKTRLPEHLRDRAVWEEDFEIESPGSRAAPRVFRRLHTAGLRGLDRLPLPPDQRAHARGRSRHHPRGHGPRRRRRAGDAPEPVAVRPLLRRPRALDGARPRLQRLRRRALRPVLRPHLPHRADPDHRRRRRRRRDRAGRGRGLPRRAPPRHAAAQLLHARPRPGVGGAVRHRAPAVLPHADRRGERARRGGRHPQGRAGERRPGEPADDREGRRQADGHPGRLQHPRAVAAHLPARRRRRARALPRPALLPDRVQRPLAGVARRRDGQVLGHRHRPGRRLVARPVGRLPPGRRPAGHGAAVPAQREVAVPADAERVRAAPVPRAVPGRPRRHRLPAPHRPVDARVGQRLPARRGHLPRQPRAQRQAVRRRPRRRAQGHPRRHPRRPPRLRRRSPPEPARRGPSLRRARRASSPARAAASGGPTRACSPSAGRSVVVNDLGGAVDGTGADAAPAAEVVAEIEAAGGKAVADASDVSTEDGAAALVDTAIEQFGRIDALVANAGIMRWGGFPDVDREDARAAPRSCTSAARSSPPGRRGRTSSSRATAASCSPPPPGCSGCATTPPTPPPRAPSSAWRAASPSPAPTTASR